MGYASSLLFFILDHKDDEDDDNENGRYIQWLILWMLLVVALGYYRGSVDIYW